MRLAVLPVVLSCGFPTAPPSFAPSDFEAREFQPSATYRIWWDELLQCSDREGEFDDIRFFEVLAPLTRSRQQFECFDGGLCTGAWERPDEIYIASGSLGSERTVKHEMLHFLLQGGEHGPVFFECTR